LPISAFSLFNSNLEVANTDEEDEHSQRLAKRMAELGLEGLRAMDWEGLGDGERGEYTDFSTSDDEMDDSRAAKLNLQLSEREMKCQKSLQALAESRLEAQQQREAMAKAWEVERVRLVKLKQERAAAGEEDPESESEGEATNEEEPERGVTASAAMAEHQRRENEMELELREVDRGEGPAMGEKHGPIQL
jgi:hypothetical protein